MQNGLAIGLGSLALAAAVAVGTLEWLSARNAQHQLAGSALPEVSQAAPAASVERPHPIAVGVPPVPGVDSSVERYRRMRAGLGVSAGS